MTRFREQGGSETDPLPRAVLARSSAPTVFIERAIPPDTARSPDPRRWPGPGRCCPVRSRPLV